MARWRIPASLPLLAKCEHGGGCRVSPEDYEAMRRFHADRLRGTLTDTA